MDGSPEKGGRVVILDDDDDDADDEVMVVMTHDDDQFADADDGAAPVAPPVFQPFSVLAQASTLRATNKADQPAKKGAKGWTKKKETVFKKQSSAAKSSKKQGQKRKLPKSSAPSMSPTAIAKRRNKKIVIKVEQSDSQQLMGVALSDTQAKVWRAVRLVGEQLRSGCWSEAEPGRRFQAAVALEKFAREIIGPYMQSSEEPMDSGRVFMATLIALREVMIQNAHLFFSIKKDGRNEEESLLAGKLMATGVVVAAYRALFRSLGGVMNNNTTSIFLQLMEQYDMGHHDFVSCSERLDERSAAILPNGESLDREQTIAWKASYNATVRANHPLLVLSEEEKKGSAYHNQPRKVVVAPPSACAFYLVEKIPPKVLSTNKLD